MPYQVFYCAKSMPLSTPMAYYKHFSIFRLQLFYYNYNIIWRFIVNYQLELKQIVDFPRCRIYREFIQTLMKDRSIRTNGGSCLFYFLILCSYANYSSSYRNIEHLTYKVVPGEWICSLKELQIHFRQKFQHQVISILDTLVEQNLLTYSLHEKIRLSNTRSKTGQKIILPFPIITHAKKTSGFSFFQSQMFIN